jgi:hypothetical protein
MIYMAYVPVRSIAEQAGLTVNNAVKALRRHSLFSSQQKSHGKCRGRISFWSDEYLP